MTKVLRISVECSQGDREREQPAVQKRRGLLLVDGLEHFVGS